MAATPTGELGPELRSPAEKVLNDTNLLYCIACWLTPRGRLAFSAVNSPSKTAVATAEFWSTISGNIIEDEGGKTSWSYSEAALYGNRLGYVLRRFGHLCRRLKLANTPWLQVTGLEDIGRCKNLVHLDVSGCRHYCVDLLGHLVRHCPSLRSLIARGCARICEPNIIQDLFDAPEGLRLNLEHLDLQGVLFAQDAAATQGSDLCRAVARLVRDRLVTLRLGWSGESCLMDKEVLATAAPRESLYGRSRSYCRPAHGPTLRRSDEPYLQTILNEVLLLASHQGGTMRLLDLAGFRITGVMDAALSICLGSLSGLRALCLSNWQGIGVGSALRCCAATQILHLNLRGNMMLLDGDLRPLLAANPGLRSLNIGCCGLLSDNTLAALGETNRQLTSLDVCYSTRMSSAGVRAVWASLPELTEFGFSGIRGLTDADIEDLVTQRPRLRMIGIGGIDLLTDAALRSIASRCGPSLETLYAADLPGVTSAGLAALLGSYTRLRRLQMERCGKLLLGDLAIIRENYPYQFDGDMLPYNIVQAENTFLDPA